MFHTELEGGVLRHELVGQLVGTDGLGVGAGQRRDGPAEAAPHRLHVEVYGAVLVEHRLARARQRDVLHARYVLVAQGRVVEGGVDYAAGLLHFRVRGRVPDERDRVRVVAIVLHVGDYKAALNTG